MINNEHPNIDGNRVQNTYTVRVMGRKDVVVSDSGVVSYLYLQNMGGEMKAILRHEKFVPSQLKFSHGDIITVKGREQLYNSTHWMEIDELVVSNVYAKPEHLLPIEVVLEDFRPLAQKLCSHWNSIVDTSLLEFLVDVFTPCDVVMGFLTVPASVNYHHAYQCGLLVHTVEMLEELSKMKRYSKPSLERDRLVTLCIIHDLGKVRTMFGRSHNLRGRYQPHDFATLEMLSSCLERLEIKSPTDANLLRGYFKPKEWSPKMCFQIYKELAYLDNL